MAHLFCEHLDEYGVQYTRTEASYRQCVNLLERLLAGGPSPELVPLVTSAVEEWSYEDRKLREMLVDAVRDGRVLVPSGIVLREGAAAIRLRRRAKKTGHPICVDCRFVVPRLEYSEWQFAHNGQVSFRGRELVPLPTSSA